MKSMTREVISRRQLFFSSLPLITFISTKRFVNYVEMDANEAMDKSDEMQRDAEDRYFAE
ncbi:uncharacterized protein PHALS_15401 [Plasmopara halstedii]|uniref:CCD97-like C-terminal domain-containing protein n=1 Tax=Plasmopara halstedii TaxID=4781 RepID=A0A0P1AGB9_PLAHL|nr:uncharacterized protein PHALS_15401 [Plasmopara halstedii]CEG39792.1 hypothetical protein PHALS_15401 [Plasmopara halstedii]|eukprot:XP_024576161.1 hypothetical protein PHALS_15401 [Plasmopara halstedii]